MSRYTANKPAAPRKAGSTMWAGILIGILFGTGMAAGLAWYLMKSPSPFMKTEPVAAPVEAALPPASPAQQSAPPAAAAGKGKPRFEFYNVLTDKPGAKAPVKHPEKQTEKPTADKQAAEKVKPADSKPAAAYAPQILQLGSFASVADAENLKAKLALLGAEAHIQTASVPDKGVRYRVRLGPYKSEDDMNRARSFLKQNNMDGTPMRAQ